MKHLRVYSERVCSDPLKVPYLKAELTLCTQGIISSQPIKNAIIHSQDHFVLIEHISNINIYIVSLSTPAYLYDS